MILKMPNETFLGITRYNFTKRKRKGARSEESERKERGERQELRMRVKAEKGLIIIGIIVVID